MKKTFIGFILYLLTFFSVFFVYAEGETKEEQAEINNPYATSTSHTAKGRALENFTKRQYDLLFNSDLSEAADIYGDVFSVSKKVDIFSSMADEATEKREGTQERLEEILGDITSLEQAIKIIDKQIYIANEQVIAATKGVAESKKNIQTNEEEIEKIKIKVKQSTEILLEYLDYMYKKSNTSFEKGQIDNIKSILLNNQDISDLLNDLYYNSLIQVTGQHLLNEHRELITQLYRKKVQLEQDKREFSKLRKQKIILTKNLEDKRNFKANLLEVTQGKQKVYEKYLKDQLATEKRLKIVTFKEQIKLNAIKDQVLKKYNCTFVDLSKETEEVQQMKEKAPKCYAINRMIYFENKLSALSKDDKKKSKNILDWPASPRRGITAFYKDKGYRKVLGADHNAIDIRLYQGTPLKAPMDGYVLYVNKPTSLDYSFVAIKHYNGYVTVYGHLSEVHVEQYDFVTRGEIFAKSGGEYGTKGAGYISTGPHLHFEVFKNQKYIDPLSVLDTSYLKYKTLPTQALRLKYLFDFKARMGYEYKSAASNARIFTIEGKNEVERQQNFLKKYARTDFSDWKMWVDEGLAGDIDPSLIMCIGLAESSLGRNLTTAYNVGNVGNNDRGDRVGKSGPQRGIEAIVQTLNNKYLGKYNELHYLSGAGRIISGLPGCTSPGEYCYATDPKHWHPNVVRCMSHLKGEVIPDDYEFRLR